MRVVFLDFDGVLNNRPGYKLNYGISMSGTWDSDEGQC